MIKINFTNQFKKDYKKVKKRGYDIKLLEEIINILINKKNIPKKYKDHQLSGIYSKFRECHIKPDWLLIYYIDDNSSTLTLTRTGSHSDLFK